MANLNDLKYVVEDLFDSTSNGNVNTDSYFTCVVDPNPIGNISVPTEDLFIFARLRAFPQNRSTIVSNNTYSSKSQDEDGIYFIGRNKKSDGYLTTDYSNIGGVDGGKTEEGLGITNIRINMNMFTPSTVEIDFVDVRGAAIFNDYERQVGKDYYNTSKYNAFFTMPYPIFELTVKGYYGKATTYYLNLIDFKATLDGETGDFSIKTKFIGYDYAFLADIITKYVIDLNNTSVGKDLLSKYELLNGDVGLMSIPDLLQRYTKISTYIENQKKDNPDIAIITALNTVSEKINELITILGLPCTKREDKVYGNNINYETFNSLQGYMFFRDIGLFGEKLIGNVEELQSNINNRITEINTILEGYPSLSSYKLEYFTPTKSKGYTEINDELITDISDAIFEQESIDYKAYYVLSDVENKMGVYTPVYYYSFYEIRSNVDSVNTKVNELRTNTQEKIVNDLNAGFIQEIGFNPTIRNVLEVIMGNVDVFLDQLYSVCQKAESYGQERVGLLADYFRTTNSLKSTDIPHTHDKIYPFPGVYNEAGVDVWLGDIVGETNPYYPEIDIVNQLLNNSLSEQLTDILQGSIQSYSTSLGEKWVPIHPFDYSANGYDTADSFNYNGNNFDELFEVMFSRLHLLSDYSLSSSGKTDGKILSFAQLEAAYFTSKVFNSNVKETLKNTNITDFVNSAVQYAQNNVDNIRLKVRGDLTNYYQSYNTSTATTNLNPLYEIPLSDLNNLETSLKGFAPKTFAANITDVLTNRIRKNISTVLSEGLKNENFFISEPIALNILDYSDCFTNSSIYQTLLLKYNTLVGSRTLDTTQPLITFLDDVTLFSDMGKSFTNYNRGANLFNQFYYTDNNYNARAFMFLYSIGFKDASYYTNLKDKTSANLSNIPYLYAAYLGGISFQKKYPNFLTEDIKNNPNFSLIANENIFKPFKTFEDNNDYFFNVFRQFSDEFLFSGELDSALVYYIYYRKRTNITESQYNQAKDFLLQLFKKVNKVIIPSVPSDNQMVYMTDTNRVTAYAKTFAETFVYLLSPKQNSTPNANTEQNAEENNLVVDKNLKIVIYKHLKNIYDKWLSYNTNDGKVYNFSRYLRKGNRPTKLIEHCYFIDRTWSDIGDKVVLNPTPLLTYSGQIDGNIYFFISRIIKDNNFNFYNIPAFVQFGNKNEVSNIFRPYTNVENTEGGSCMIFQYVAGNSKVLDLNAESAYYLNDGFDFNARSKTFVPPGFNQKNVPSYYVNSVTPYSKEYLDKFNLCIFRVSYADQNQSIFKKVNVTQEDHRETAESMTIQDQLAGGKGGTKRIYMGADLYNAYAVRSYRTDVECMGNTQIFPTMYFQLDNIPLFHGAHMITNVKHTITPHDMVTEFGGRRISKFVYPLVDKITSYFNIGVNDRLQTSVTSAEDYSIIVDGRDNEYYTSEGLVSAGFTLAETEAILFGGVNIGIPSTNNPSEVFRVVGPTGNISSYVLSNNVNQTTLNNNLSKVFNPNGFNNYSAGVGYCAKWTRLALAELGIYKNQNILGNAWDWAAGLPENGYVQYFSPNQKLYGWSNQDFIGAGLKNGSLLFGHTIGSSYTDEAYRTIRDSKNQARIDQLTRNRRVPDYLKSRTTEYPFSIITHIGIFYNGLFYNLHSRVPALNLQAASNFIPVMAYQFMPTAINIASKR